MFTKWTQPVAETWDWHGTFHGDGTMSVRASAWIVRPFSARWPSGMSREPLFILQLLQCRVRNWMILGRGFPGGNRFPFRIPAPGEAVRFQVWQIIASIPYQSATAPGIAVEPERAETISAGTEDCVSEPTLEAKPPISASVKALNAAAPLGLGRDIN